MCLPIEYVGTANIGMYLILETCPAKCYARYKNS